MADAVGQAEVGKEGKGPAGMTCLVYKAAAIVIILRSTQELEVRKKLLRRAEMQQKQEMGNGKIGARSAQQIDRIVTKLYHSYTAIVLQVTHMLSIYSNTRRIPL